MTDDRSAVVYFFMDPTYQGDLGPCINTLRESGCRVVKGDNAEELLFLLQVGRPTAIIWTFATEESANDSGYRIVEARAMELLVPIFQTGPDDPREGFILLTPKETSHLETHIPIHSLVDAIMEMHLSPPSTHSRPPAAVNQITMGKGRGMMKWRTSQTTPRQVPIQTHSGSEESKVSKSAPLVRTVESFRHAPLPSTSVPPVDSPASSGNGPHRPVSHWKVVVLSVIAVSIAMVAGGSYLMARRIKATSPSPQTMYSNPDARPDDTTESDPGTSGSTAPVPVEPADSNPGAAPDKIVPLPDIPEHVPTQRAKVRPAVEERIVFPGRFRTGSAQFWFEDNMDLVQVMKFVRSRPSGSRIRVVGHPTVSDVEKGKLRMGTARAGAVVKYLVKRGVPATDLVHSGGDPVPDNTDRDERGRATNRWVELIIEKTPANSADK